LHDKYKLLNQNRELDREKLRSNYISKYESLKKIAYENSPDHNKTQKKGERVTTEPIPEEKKQKSG